MMATINVGVLAAMLALGGRIADTRGEMAVYVCRSGAQDYPGRVERIEIKAGAKHPGPQQIAVRYAAGQRSFGFVAVGTEAWSLLAPGHACALDQYFLERSTGQALEFQCGRTGRAFLPFSFQLQPDAILPSCFGENRTFRHEIRFLGETYDLVETGTLHTPMSVPPARLIVLSDDLLVGTSRNERDTDGRRISQREFVKDEQLDYSYRPLNENDLGRMLAAGFNYFDRVSPEQLPYLIDKPAFFDLQGFVGHQAPIFPEIFFHPGFQGVEDFLDEPAYIFWEDFSPPPGTSLEEMAGRQEERTANEYNRTRRGRMTGMMELLGKSGVDLKELVLVEPPFPVWEEFYSTACYHMRVPVSGIVHEGRYRHPQIVKLLNLTFRTGMPRRPETMFRFYYSFLRGAARVFDRDWGMSIYGQADSDVSLLGMTMAYDRGARYIWFWSSDRDHHLPFEEQLALADGLSRYVREHPRKPRRELIRSVQDAIVLPYGFTFSISDWQRTRVAALWQRDAFPIETGKLPDGTPYYAVLRCAAEKMEELIDEGREFDVVIDVPELAQAGYLRRHDVLPDARRYRYEYPWYIHYRLHFILAGLVIFLIGFRTYRIIRWVRRRRRAAGQ